MSKGNPNSRADRHPRRAAATEVRVISLPLEITQHVCRQWLVKIVWNREFAPAESEWPQGLGWRDNRFDFRHGLVISHHQQSLSSLDPAEKCEWIALDFLDTDPSHHCNHTSPAALPLRKCG